MHNEARAMAGLDHPHVLRVYDIEHDDEHDFIVMELALGGSLQDRVDREGPLSPREAVAYAVQVLAALAAAHAAGIVHRDVKPQNILLDNQGRARLADFGIALLTTEGASRGTRTGMAMGSRAFMAPERRYTDSREFALALVEAMPAADLPATAPPSPDQFPLPSPRVLQPDDSRLYPSPGQPTVAFEEATSTAIDSLLNDAPPRTPTAVGHTWVGDTSPQPTPRRPGGSWWPGAGDPGWCLVVDPAPHRAPATPIEATSPLPLVTTPDPATEPIPTATTTTPPAEQVTPAPPKAVPPEPAPRRKPVAASTVVSGQWGGSLGGRPAGYLERQPDTGWPGPAGVLGTQGRGSSGTVQAEKDTVIWRRTAPRPSGRWDQGDGVSSHGLHRAPPRRQRGPDPSDRERRLRGELGTGVVGRVGAPGARVFVGVAWRDK